MELHKKIKFDDKYWCIIKLDEEEQKVIGHEFVVSQRYPHKYWQEHHGLILMGD